MLIVYLIFALEIIATIWEIIKSAKEKSVRRFVFAILPLPFFFCMFLGFISGGTALNNAKNDYNLYQAGHYYLVSHGKWTEVSYRKYIFVFFSEIFGFSLGALCMILSICRDIKRKPKPNRLPNINP